MSFLAELKRRNVLRVAVGYAVASWLLLQITDVLSSVLGLPPLAGRFVFLLLVIGLVPVLAFAWSYQVTPEGLKRDRGTGGGSVETARNLDRATIAMLIAVTAMVLVDRYLPREESVQEAHEDIFAESAVPETSAASRSDETHDDNTVSLAILPFTNMSPDPENEYFSDGVSEELISLLMRVDGLRVPSRTSSFAWKGQSRDIREIARELQVGHILEGSVRKAGNRVRITAQLIDTTTDTHLWSQTWDRDLEDIFAIQEDIAGHIVDSLQVVLDREAIQLRPTENLAAYSLYLEGRQLFQRRGDGLAEAVRLLREAVRLDPDFAEAWATLSLAYGTLPGYIDTDAKAALGKAIIAAHKALELDPENVDALLGLGHALDSRGRYGEALALSQRAADLEPNNAFAQYILGTALLEAGYIAEALVHLELALRLDPLSAAAMDYLAHIMLMLERQDEALQLAQRALRLGRAQAITPVFFLAVTTADLELAHQSYAQAGPYAEAFEHFLLLYEDPSGLQAALDYSDELEGQGRVTIAVVVRTVSFLAVGDATSFLAQLQLLKQFGTPLSMLIWTPLAARHRADPAMQVWIVDTGLDTLWRERGAPDLCRPAEDGWSCR